MYLFMASQPHSAGVETECSRKNGVKVKFFSRITRVEIEFSHFKIAEILFGECKKYLEKNSKNTKNLIKKIN